MLQEVVKVFFPYNLVAEVIPFGNGHINNTYRVRLQGEKPNYILQRINTQVFPDPIGIVETHARLEDAVFKMKESLTIARLIRTADGRKLHIDPLGGAWRMTSFISDSYSLEIAQQKWQAFEAGNAFGWFARSCHKLDAADFREPIKDFHSLTFRIQQLNDAIADDKVGRLADVADVVRFYKNFEEQLTQIEELVARGDIPQRIVHNDTKINNLLFRDDKAVAIIDLDTVGPGILYYDYGDALRTCANTAEEDEKDLTKVSFNMDAFTSFTMGYMGQVRSIVNQKEEELFYKAPFLMTFIMGIRFLADYLNGDVYYKTAWNDHNLARSLVQKKLIESMTEKQNLMKAIIDNALNEIPVF